MVSEEIRVFSSFIPLALRLEACPFDVPEHPYCPDTRYQINQTYQLEGKKKNIIKFARNQRLVSSLRTRFVLHVWATKMLNTWGLWKDGNTPLKSDEPEANFIPGKNKRLTSMGHKKLLS